MGLLLLGCYLAALCCGADSFSFWENFYDRRPLWYQSPLMQRRLPSSVHMRTRTRDPLLGHIRRVRRLEWSILEPYPFVLSGPWYRFQNEWVFSPHPIQNSTLIDIGRMLREQDFLWMP